MAQKAPLEENKTQKMAKMNPKKVKLVEKIKKMKVEQKINRRILTKHFIKEAAIAVVEMQKAATEDAEMLTADIEPLLMYNMKTGVAKPTAERLAVIG